MKSGSHASQLDSIRAIPCRGDSSFIGLPHNRGGEDALAESLHPHLEELNQTRAVAGRRFYSLTLHDLGNARGGILRKLVWLTTERPYRKERQTVLFTRWLGITSLVATRATSP